MSRAFVSEEATEASAASLPERPVSAAPNLVTPSGLAQIEAQVARLEEARARTPQDYPQRPVLDRDLRYWRARRATATLVPPASGDPDEMGFGCTVTVSRAGGGTATYTIVGEDEADPPRGLLSWTSPLAEALAGARVGDTVEVGGGRPAVTVERIGRGS